MTRTIISQANLARKTQEVADRVQEGAVAAVETSGEDLIGCTGYRGPARTLEEIEAGIAKGARQWQNP